MNLYNQEEVDRIAKVKEVNDKMEDFFNDKRIEWSKNALAYYDTQLKVENAYKTIIDEIEKGK